MDGGGTTVVSPTVATTATEVPHHAQQFVELVLDLLSRSRWPMPSVRRGNHAAMAGAFHDAWRQTEWHGAADAADGEEVDNDDDDDDAYGGWLLLGAVPASGDAMAALPETTVGEGAAGEEEECCAVCLEEYVRGDALRTMPCKHGFHEACILPWLRVSRLCPLCRFALPAAEAGADSDSSSSSEENWWDNDDDEEDDRFVTESGDEAGGTP